MLLKQFVLKSLLLTKLRLHILVFLTQISNFVHKKSVNNRNMVLGVCSCGNKCSQFTKNNNAPTSTTTTIPEVIPKIKKVRVKKIKKNNAISLNSAIAVN